MAKAKAPPSQTTTVVAKVPINHDGNAYSPGDRFEVLMADFDQLLAVGAAAPEAEAAEADPAAAEAESPAQGEAD